MQYQVFTIEYEENNIIPILHWIKSFTDMTEAKIFAKELAESYAETWIMANKDWVKESFDRDADFADVYKQLGKDDEVILSTSNWGFSPVDDDYPEIRVVYVEP